MCERMNSLHVVVFRLSGASGMPWRFRMFTDGLIGYFMPEVG